MGTDGTFAYYNEHGTFTPTSGSAVAETHTDTCDSSFEPNMVMDGPIYSQDAYLIDRGKDTGNSKNSMPIFGGNAYSMWDGTINGVQQPVNPNTHGHDRSYPGTDGDISTTIDPQPVYTSRELELPASGAKSQALASCVYTGPTRILIKQNVAYITSPGTPTGSGACYASTGSFKAGSGVTNAQVPIASTLIYIKNPTSGSPSLATRANPIFNLTSSTSPPAATGTDNLTGTWDNTTYSATQACPSPANPAKRRNFDCETSKDTPAGDMATAIAKAADDTVKAGAASAAAMKTNVTNAITALVKASALSQPATFDTTHGYYYTITVGSVAMNTTTTNPPDLSPSDAFYQKSTTGSFTTTTFTAPITISRVTCTAMKKGSCDSTQSSPIYQGSATGSSSSGGAAATTESFPWFGKQAGDTGYDAAKTYTDPTNDITQYHNGYGDAYVEGTLKGSMTIVAEHDIVATNNITYNNTNLNTTTDGLALVANHDVRVYRPMTCTDNGTAGVTSAGYCPDDLTGVYTNSLSWPLPTNYPALKYTPDSAPSMTTNGDGVLYATVFALRGCFMMDNFYRGGIGHGVSVYGGLYQYHRGPTSLPYQGRPYQGSGTKMPGVTLSYEYDNMRAGQTDNGGLRVPWIPTPQGRPAGSTRTWNVIAISTGS
jgi:hypothetical protein